MDNIIFSALVNLGLSGVLVAVVGFLAKKYFDGLEDRGKLNADNIEEVRRKTAGDLAKATEKTLTDIEKRNAEMTKELRMVIHENREEYKESHLEIIKRLEDMTEQMRTANGRTRKNELTIETVRGLVHTQITLCKDRNTGRRASDRCGDPMETGL